MAIIDPLAHDAGDMTPDAARSLPMPLVLLAEAAVDLARPNCSPRSHDEGGSLSY